jgi:hypothetical protein
MTLKGDVFIRLTTLLVISLLQAGWGEERIPVSHKDLKNPISYSAMQTILETLTGHEHIGVSIAGSSVSGRSLYLVRLRHESDNVQIPVFLFGQQHGNEPAGKDALIYLIQYMAENPALLPEDIDLWIMPMVNPDGAFNNQRRNANDADLNRDHQLLAQPETRILHEVFRKIMPLISVDCHEFSRDSREYTSRGWTEWPQIMMDCCNNPLFNSSIYELGVRWCAEVETDLQKAGYHYTRYFVGGAPPEEEQRFSTPEVDDARNGLGAYGGLSFIIESGFFSQAENVHADLARRVDAYLILLKQLLMKASNNKELINLVEHSRNEHIPAFIPTNYFWANAGNKESRVKVISRETGEILSIPTTNFMPDLIVKGSVATPRGYVIEAKNKDSFTALLDRHAIDYEILNRDKEFNVQPGRLIRVEDFRDSLYNRYEGRQIVEIGPSQKRLFPAHSIYVALDQKAARRAALLLEPRLLYGIYKYDAFRKLVDPDGTVPVWRVAD